MKKSAPADRASHNSGERLPNSDVASAGADTVWNTDAKLLDNPKPVSGGSYKFCPECGNVVLGITMKFDDRTEFHAQCIRCDWGKKFT